MKYGGTRAVSAPVEELAVEGAGVDRIFLVATSSEATNLSIAQSFWPGSCS